MMTTMSLPATDEILDAAEHLPYGATLIVPEVSWDAALLIPEVWRYDGRTVQIRVDRDEVR